MKRRHFFKIAGAAATAVVVPLPALPQPTPAPTLEPTREPTPGQFYEVAAGDSIADVARGVLLPLVVTSSGWVDGRLAMTFYNPNDVPVPISFGGGAR